MSLLEERRKEFKKIFFSLFKKANWGKDIINFLYMLDHLGYIEIKLKKNGKIDTCKTLSREYNRRYYQKKKLERLKREKKLERENLNNFKLLFINNKKVLFFYY